MLNQKLNKQKKKTNIFIDVIKQLITLTNIVI
jgi:hypothetical protein